MANITVTVPDDKIDLLTELYQKRYGLTDSLATTKAKTDFLGKVLSHETVGIVRQVIIETAQAQAKEVIKADASINKTDFEAELENKSILGATVEPEASEK